MNKNEELAEIVKLHREWLESGNRSGKRADLSGASLDNTSLVNTNLSGAIFRGASLKNADLQGATLIHANFSDVDLSRANLENANLLLVDFTGADLKDAVLTDTALPAEQTQSSIRRGPRFTDANLENADLRRSYCFASDFSGANLKNTQLQSAYLEEANLSNIELADGQLQSANLRGANLEMSNIQGANLRNACLSEANLHMADLAGCDLREADLRSANMSHTKVDGVIYNRITRFRGVRLHGCYGSSRFRRYAEDQDYIEEFKEAHPNYYRIWMGLTDCGRSMLRVICWSLALSGLFAMAYYALGPTAFHVSNEDGLSWNFFTALYYSVVTFTTLGFGDITPRTPLAAGIVMTEVVIGYVMLGILISILATKVARRS